MAQVRLRADWPDRMRNTVAAGAVGAAVGAVAALWWSRRARRRSEQMVLLAVSGTIEDGFELRRNIDAPGRPAVFVGSGLVRGVAMHLDVKDAACRERVTPDGAARPRVNPAMVPTGDPADANLYSVYAVDARAALLALLNEPRYLSMTPDLVRVDLDAEQTSSAVRALGREIARRAGAADARSAGILAVVSCFAGPTFVRVPPHRVLPDGTRMTAFAECLAAWAGVDDARDAERCGPTLDARLLAAQADADKVAHGALRYGTVKGQCRLSSLMRWGDFEALSQSACSTSLDAAQ